MKSLKIFMIGSFLAACASDKPPPASSDSVASATDNPAPNAASNRPVRTDVMRAAEADGRAEARTSQPAQDTILPPAEAESMEQSRGLVGAPAPARNNGSTEPSVDRDNTRVNQRDRDGAALTPEDQGDSAADRKVTQQIRQAIMADDSLSFASKNIKIITVNGKVTLRGTVPTSGERTTVEGAARKFSGSNQVDNQLEIKR